MTIHTLARVTTRTGAITVRDRCHRLGLSSAVATGSGHGWVVVADTTPEAVRACRMMLRIGADLRVLDEVAADTTPPPARFEVLA